MISHNGVNVGAPSAKWVRRVGQIFQNNGWLDRGITALAVNRPLRRPSQFRADVNRRRCPAPEISPAS